MKNLILLALIGFGVATICSCGSKSVKGADGTEYSSYQEACRHQDFVAAYDWIEKNNGSDDDKDYVFNAEMLYLTSLGTEDASNRIVYLLAEYQIPGIPVTESTSHESQWNDVYRDMKKYILGVMRFNKRCDNIIDMAISQGNEQLCRKIIPQYKKDIEWYDSGSWLEFNGLSNVSKETAQAKNDEAFGKQKNLEEDETEGVEETPAQPTSKKKVNSKRRKR